jgi:hypothetical protein
MEVSMSPHGQLSAAQQRIEYSQPERLSFIAWARTPGRAKEIAGAFNGEARCFFPLARLPRSPISTLLRYGVSSVLTMRFLARRRPDALIVQNPPVVPGLIAMAYGRRNKVPVLLDSHPVAFGAKGRGMYAKMQRLHRWMARRVDGVTVASEPYAEIVDAWGGRGIVVHEAPTEWPHIDTVERERPAVFFVCIFSSDEPYEEVIEAAGLLPHCDVYITGDTSRADAGVIAGAPSNVQFTGFLDQAAYRQQLQQADVVLSLTTEKTSVMRSAYEAVYARRPLVVTDWPNLRTVFPNAAYAHNEPESIAKAVIEALSTTRATADESLRVQQERWDHQLRQMQNALRPLR